MALRKALAAASALAALGLAATGAARADFDPEAWPYFRDIRVAEGAVGEHARVALDDHVFDQAVRVPHFLDLRLVRDGTEDIGRVVYAPEREPARMEKREARVFNVAKRGEEATELTVDLGETPPITNRADLRTPARNFRCAVLVEGSDDGQTWKQLRPDAAIFDFTGDERARFTAVAFPDARMRYLRFVVAAPPEGKPIDLTGATVWQELPPKEPDLPALVERPAATKTEMPQDRESWYVLDLGRQHLPVSKAVVATPQENFARTVRVDVSDDEKVWTRAADGFIFRLRTERYREERLTLEFGEAFGRYVRLVVKNYDDPPLETVNLKVYGRPRYLFFPLEAGHAYRLYYGNPRARGPAYEYAEVFPHIDRSAAVEARLGGVQRNPRFIATRPAPEPHPWLVRNQWVLYVALAVAVVALGLVALRALRRTQAAGQEAGG